MVFGRRRKVIVMEGARRRSDSSARWLQPQVRKFYIPPRTSVVLGGATWCPFDAVEIISGYSPSRLLLPAS